MLTGKCQCGSVTYKASSDISELSHCHCSMCRRLHGAAFVTFARIGRAGFEWTAGEGRVRRFASSADTDRLFCGDCGAQFGCVLESEPDSLYLAMGTVDGDPPTPPAFHTFVDSRAKWYNIGDDLPQYPGEHTGSE